MQLLKQKEDTTSQQSTITTSVSTDRCAFAVLSYQSLSEYYIQNNDKEKAKLYEVAVEKLISVVHECLGKP